MFTRTLTRFITKCLLKFVLSSILENGLNCTDCMRELNMVIEFSLLAPVWIIRLSNVLSVRRDDYLRTNVECRNNYCLVLKFKFHQCLVSFHITQEAHCALRIHYPSCFYDSASLALILVQEVILAWVTFVGLSAKI